MCYYRESIPHSRVLFWPPVICTQCLRHCHLVQRKVTAEPDNGPFGGALCLLSRNPLVRSASIIDLDCFMPLLGESCVSANVPWDTIVLRCTQLQSEYRAEKLQCLYRESRELQRIYACLGAELAVLKRVFFYRLARLGDCHRISRRMQAWNAISPSFPGSR